MFSLAEGLHEELQHGIVVTALLPGATATDFHQRAGMSNTAFGSNEGTVDPALVARRGLDTLFAGKDFVIGGDAKRRWSAVQNWVLLERLKARRSAGDCRGWLSSGGGR